MRILVDRLQAQFAEMSPAVSIRNVENLAPRNSGIIYTLNSEPEALTGDKSERLKAEAFIRGFIPS